MLSKKITDMVAKGYIITFTELEPTTGDLTIYVTYHGYKVRGAVKAFRHVGQIEVTLETLIEAQLVETENMINTKRSTPKMDGQNESTIAT